MKVVEKAKTHSLVLLQAERLRVYGKGSTLSLHFNMAAHLSDNCALRWWLKSRQLVPIRMLFHEVSCYVWILANNAKDNNQLLDVPTPTENLSI